MAIGRTIAKLIREVKYIDPIFPRHHIGITDMTDHCCYTNAFVGIPKARKGRLSKWQKTTESRDCITEEYACQFIETGHSDVRRQAV